MGSKYVTQNNNPNVSLEIKFSIVINDVFQFILTYNIIQIDDIAP